MSLTRLTSSFSEAVHSRGVVLTTESCATRLPAFINGTRMLCVSRFSSSAVTNVSSGTLATSIRSPAPLDSRSRIASPRASSSSATDTRAAPSLSRRRAMAVQITSCGLRIPASSPETASRNDIRSFASTICRSSCGFSGQVMMVGSPIG